MEVPSTTYVLDQFKPLVGENFKTTLPSGESIELSLFEAEALQLHKRDGRLRATNSSIRKDPFTLTFLYDVLIPQGLYTLSHETFGDAVIFLVPIGPFEDGWGHEAVFN